MSINAWRGGVDLILNLYYNGQLTRPMLDEFRLFHKGKVYDADTYTIAYETLLLAADEFCGRQDDYTAMQLNLARWRAYPPRSNYDRPTERTHGYDCLY